jgi:hypothetical protein
MTTVSVSSEPRPEASARFKCSGYPVDGSSNHESRASKTTHGMLRTVRPDSLSSAAQQNQDT